MTFVGSNPSRDLRHCRVKLCSFSAVLLLGRPRPCEISYRVGCSGQGSSTGPKGQAYSGVEPLMLSAQAKLLPDRRGSRTGEMTATFPTKASFSWGDQEAHPSLHKEGG